MSIKATFEVLFNPTDHIEASDLAAEVVRAVHPAIAVDSVSVIDRPDAPGARLDLSLFASEAEVEDHRRRFRNITGVPPHDVFLISMRGA